MATNIWTSEISFSCVSLCICFIKFFMHFLCVFFRHISYAYFHYIFLCVFSTPIFIYLVYHYFYMFLYIYTCIYICVCMYRYVRTSIYLHVYVYIEKVHLCKYLFIYIFLICTFVHICCWEEKQPKNKQTNRTEKMNTEGPLLSYLWNIGGSGPIIWFTSPQNISTCITHTPAPGICVTVTVTQCSPSRREGAL